MSRRTNITQLFQGSTKRVKFEIVSTTSNYFQWHKKNMYFLFFYRIVLVRFTDIIPLQLWKFLSSDWKDAIYKHRGLCYWKPIFRICFKCLFLHWVRRFCVRSASLEVVAGEDYRVSQDTRFVIWEFVDWEWVVTEYLMIEEWLFDFSRVICEF